MKINKEEFIYFITKGLIQNLSNLSQKHKEFMLKKADQLVDLIKELDELVLLKNLAPKDIDEINKSYDLSSYNIGEIGKMGDTFIQMIRNSGKTRGTGFKLKDQFGHEYTITAHQIANFIGIAYASSCEFNRIWLSSIIDTNKLERIPAGIGELRYLLDKAGVTKLEFFNHIDSDLRNSFFHLNFKFDNMNIYYEGRHKTTKMIELQDLFNLAINVDRSGLVLMHICSFYLHKYQENLEISLGVKI